MALSFSHAVLVWARSKPADEAYRYVDPNNCAICQFIFDTGRAKVPRVVLNRWRDGYGEGEWHDFDDRIRAAAIGYPHNFGAFAARLEKALAQ